MLWTQALASTLASVAFSGSPAVDGATTFHASFDDQKQPDYALVVGEPFGNAEPVDDGRFGAAMRFGRRTRLNFAIDGQTWSRPEGTIEFWLRPEWSTDESFSIVSVRGPGPDRLDINRDRIGRLGVAVRGGLPGQPDVGTAEPARWRAPTEPVAPRCGRLETRAARDMGQLGTCGRADQSKPLGAES